MEGKDGWGSALRDVLIGLLLAFILLIAILGAMFLYSNAWPPLSVIESNSMQHDATSSGLGIIDTGDMVIVKSSDGTDVISYVEGSKSAYEMFGGYGDAIIYRPLGSSDGTPIIHRTIIWLDYNDSNGWNAPSLEGYDGEWAVSAGDGWNNMTGTLLLKNIGYANVTVIIELDSLDPHSGYVTMGDFNWRNVPILKRVGYVDQLEEGPSALNLVRPEWVESRAMVEIPWVGLIKLYANDKNLDMIPLNSIYSLGISVFLILAIPLLSEYAFDRYRRKRE